MARVGYVCIGTNDLDRATSFYDQLLGSMGGQRLMPTPNGMAYRLNDGAMVMVTKPYDKNDATVGNGMMIAFQMDSKAQVAALHAKALELGGTCDGPPGPRGPMGEFAYFRDPEGNKLAAFCLG